MNERFPGKGAPVGVATRGDFPLDGVAVPPPKLETPESLVLDNIRLAYQTGEARFPINTPENRAAARIKGLQAVGFKVIIDSRDMYYVDEYGFRVHPADLGFYKDAFRNLMPDEPVRIFAEKSAALDIKENLERKNYVNGKCIAEDPEAENIDHHIDYFRLITYPDGEEIDLAQIQAEILEHPKHALVIIGSSHQNQAALSVQDYVAYYLAPEGSPCAQQLEEAGAAYFTFRDGQDIDNINLEVSSKVAA